MVPPQRISKRSREESLTQWVLPLVIQRYTSSALSTEQKYLRKRTILVTSPLSANKRLVEPLRAAGAEVFHFPMIRFAEPGDPKALQEAASQVGPGDWLALLSPRAARAWLEVAPKGAAVNIAVVGGATRAALEAAGQTPQLEASQTTAVGLADALLAQAPASIGQPLRVTLLQGEQGRPDFAERMRAAGAELTTIEAYRTLPPSDAEYERFEQTVRDRSVDAVVFSSPSTFSHFWLRPNLREKLRAAQVFAIGPTTSEGIRAEGIACHTAEPHSYEGLVNLICRQLGAICQNRDSE